MSRKSEIFLNEVCLDADRMLHDETDNTEMETFPLPYGIREHRSGVKRKKCSEKELRIQKSIRNSMNEMATTTKETSDTIN